MERLSSSEASILLSESVAGSIRALLATPGQRREFDAPAAVDWASRRMGVELTGEQRQAIQEAVSQKVFVLTGGPGTGKTTILRAVISILEALDQRVALAAPTGRAAKRLGEATGREARTLHRLLEFKPGEGGYGRERRAAPGRRCRGGRRDLDAGHRAVATTCYRPCLCQASVLFVGDANQLPSVGPGKVLGDVLESGVVPFIRLERIFRQGERSGIVQAAHRVNQGRMPSLSLQRLPGGLLLRRRPRNPEAAANAVVRICAERIPAQFGLRPVRDVQVLCPMNRGDLSASISSTTGSGRCSTRQGTEVTRFRPGPFRVGDRVLQFGQTTTTRTCSNGDLGWVTGVNHAAGRITVSFEETGVVLRFLGTGRTANLLRNDRTPGPREASFPRWWFQLFDAALPDAAAQPAVYRDHQGEEAGRGCRKPAGVGHGGAQRPSRGAQLHARDPAFGDGDRRRDGVP